MAQAKEPKKESMSLEEAAEVLRQVIKQNEFNVRALDAINTAFEAEKEIKAKRAAISALQAEHDQAAAHQKERLAAQNEEAEKNLLELKQNYDLVANNYAAEISREQAKLRDIGNKIKERNQELEVLKTEKASLEDELPAIRLRAAKEREEFEKEAKREKDKLNEELESLRQIIRRTRGAIEGLQNLG